VTKKSIRLRKSNKESKRKGDGGTLSRMIYRGRGEERSLNDVQGRSNLREGGGKTISLKTHHRMVYNGIDRGAEKGKRWWVLISKKHTLKAVGYQNTSQL